ncbi:MAG: secretin N-terminal domain-containing protein, partial [Candidatus Omnitrophota bacterium]
LQEIVKKILTEFGKITEDPSTNSLIVTDVPSQFATIDEVVASLDIAVPKVLIEVEMLDVNKALADQIGVTYGDSGLVGNFTLGSMMTPFPFPSRLINTIPQSAMPGGLANIPDRIQQMSILNLQDIRIILQLLKTDTTTKFLARPKILTLSGETAEVNLTTQEAIGVTTASSSSGGGTLTQTVERTETGTTLRVTPHVNAYTKEVTLFVEVRNSQATATGIRLTGMTTGNVMNPEVRGTQVVMRLKNGETLLIGGLIRNNDTTTITKIPFLGDIPFIGQAFRHKSKSDTKRELMVFLTPHVISDSPVLARRESAVQREQDSFQRESIRVAMDRVSREY